MKVPYRLFCGDCLEKMKKIPDNYVDMVMCDPPYGTTACKWDSVIPLEPMWKQLERICKKNAAIVIMASQPFTSVLVCSNLLMFKYSWVWKKTRPGGFVSAKLKPLKDVEDICVFSKGVTANGSKQNMPYYPQGVNPGIPWKRPKRYKGSEGVNYIRESHLLERVTSGSGYPREIIEFANPNSRVLHPTQKPVALMEYLIKTYTNEGETVLDFAFGSGTTGVACGNLNRKFIGIELSEEYFEIAEKRIQKAYEAPGFRIEC